MTLRQKSQLIIGLTFLGLVAMLVVLDQVMISRAYRDLERSEVEQETRRAANAVATELRNLDRFVNDWAAWDDTYEFVVNPSAHYLDANLVDETFVESNVNVIVIVGQDGEVRYARALDLATRAPLSLPQLTDQRITAGHPFALPATATEGVSGLYRAGEQLLLVAARPILTSERMGPSRGVMIMGRVLSPELVATFSSDLQLDIEMVPTRPDVQPELPGASPGGAIEMIAVSPVDGEMITGSALLTDLEGRPAVMTTVTLPREIYREGLVTFRELAVVLSAGTLVLILVMAVVLHRTVVQRIQRLGHDVSRIGAHRDASARVPVTGSDEVGRLAGEVNAMLGSLQDAAEQRVALQGQIAAGQRLSASVLEEMAEGLVVLDDRGICRMCNRTAARLLRIEPSVLLGQPLEVIQAIPAEVRDVVANLLAGTARPGRVRAHVHDRVLVVHTSSYGDRGGEPLGWILVLRDVTEAAHTEQQRRDFVSIIGHELRTPATVIRTSIDLLSEATPGELTPMQQRIVDVLDANTHRLLGVLEDLLDLSAIEAGQLQVTPDTEDIGAIVEAAVEAQRPQADASRIRLVYHAPAHRVQARADRQRVRQVLANLLSNAIKYTPAGGDVSVWLTADEHRARVSVTDTGIGITAEEQVRLFQPYYRSPRARQFGSGTGLGLSIARSLAELHGGSLWCESDGEGGSTFHFTLPLAEHGLPLGEHGAVIAP